LIYSVRHVTTFGYQPAVRESVMELRMQPLSDSKQRCLSFRLNLTPSANIMQYSDFLGNIVHHFDIAGTHTQLKVTAYSVVEVHSISVPTSDDGGDWSELDALTASEDCWEMLLPSYFAQPTELLEAFAREIGSGRTQGPYATVIKLNQTIYDMFDYVPNSTKVDSPIEDALSSRKGVCQDFAHIMIALLRRLKMPARYVSGYLFHEAESHDRSTDGASHAWVEVLLPKLGWVSFDPTNNLIASDRHIRVAIGRDYSDVPPTRGVYKGDAHSELSVSVTVSPSDRPLPEEMMPSIVEQPRPAIARTSFHLGQEQQQQQVSQRGDGARLGHHNPFICK
jgi:transglutaminase-like putative cysteine protease